MTTTNRKARPVEPLRQPSVIREVLAEAALLSQGLLENFNLPQGPDPVHQVALEEGVTRLLSVRDALCPVIDADGALRNWLVDVVRQVRRGNPGAGRYELERVGKRLDALRAEWA